MCEDVWYAAAPTTIFSDGPAHGESLSPTEEEHLPATRIWVKMPTVKSMKLPIYIERFTEKEEYKGFEEGFEDWGFQILDGRGSAHSLRGGEWPVEYSTRTLNWYLDGITRMLLTRWKVSGHQKCLHLNT